MVRAGHDVTGVHLALSQVPSATRAGSRGCCSMTDARDARRVADVLGIPFYVWDVSEAFERDVVTDFLQEYAAGRTPNPCVRCNEQIKFSAVLDRALALGFDKLCTGHYAQLQHGPFGPLLRRAVDNDKDQSYVLGVLTGQQLAHSLFPVGDTPKRTIRDEAAQAGLVVADKPDSTDLCFVPDGDTASYLRERLGPRPGSIVDPDGAVVGRHDGAFSFTIGQRKGLGIDTASQDGRPRYVLSVEPVSRTVTVGSKEELAVASLQAEHVRWNGGRPSAPVVALAQFRAHGGVCEVTVAPSASGVTVSFVDDQRGVAPGQTIVFYADDVVLGSATITETSRTR